MMVDKNFGDRVCTEVVQRSSEETVEEVYILAFSDRAHNFKWALGMIHLLVSSVKKVVEEKRESEKAHKLMLMLFNIIQRMLTFKKDLLSSAQNVLSCYEKHDINNAFTVLQGSVEFLYEDFCEGKDVIDQDWREIIAALNIMEQIIDVSLCLNNRDSNKIQEMINGAVCVARARGKFYGGGIEIIKDVSPEDSVITFHYAAMCARVLVNVLINAVDAFDVVENQKKVIWINVSTHSSNLIVNIMDNGIGMDGETLKRAFEFGFTTKGNNGGSGLGLDYCKRALEKEGGSIELSSQGLGFGTKVCICIPIA